MNVLIFAQGAKGGFRAEVVDFVHAVFDVVRRLHLIHLELGFRTIEFGEQRFEEAIAFCGGVGSGHGGVRSGFCFVRGASRNRAQCEENRTRIAIIRMSRCEAADTRRIFMASPPAFQMRTLAAALSSNPGGGKSGGRSCSCARFCTSISEKSIAGATAATGTCPLSAPQTPLKTCC